MMVKGIFFKSYHGYKIVKIEMDGELFTVHFATGEKLEKLTINELNHVVVTATGR